MGRRNCSVRPCLDAPRGEPAARGTEQTVPAAAAPETEARRQTPEDATRARPRTAHGAAAAAAEDRGTPR